MKIMCALCGSSFDDDAIFHLHLNGCGPFQHSDGIVYPDGSITYEIEPLLFGEARIIETDGVGIFRQWHYEKKLVAASQLAIWERKKYNGMPDGWDKAIIDPRQIKQINEPVKNIIIAGNKFSIKRDSLLKFFYVYSEEIKKYLLRDGSLGDSTTIEENGEAFYVGWFNSFEEINSAAAKHHD